MTDLPPSAHTVIGLLADPDRRRVLAAVELGATTLDDATRVSGLPEQRASRAFGKLVESGALIAGQDGGFAVDGNLFAAAARSALARRRDEHDVEPPEIKRVLDAFVGDGRITSMPTVAAKRQVLFDWLARRFEVGRRYAESEVNSMLDGHCEDPASLRRALVDHELLDRAEGLYWRCGGTVELDP